MASKKIVVIGAASRFGPGLVENVIKTEELRGSHVVLIDLNASRAETLARYGRQRAKAGGLTYQIEEKSADERCNALFHFKAVRQKYNIIFRTYLTRYK